ncbi:hypothetical protein VTK73DRAFT_7599 [Phialemonium thermophilum]|uniref:Aminotransferase class I/classII large domain-containing protein n=1 Tax=Phialemonium thermophilum TaxID=223376 RepID=A0ABR3WDJ2_9PEZI
MATNGCRTGPGRDGPQRGLPAALDLSHHLNARSKARHPSPLKDIIKYMAQEGMVSLAGGLPHPSLFPIKEARFSILDPSSSSSPGIQSLGTRDVLLDNDPACDPPLTKFLQYGTCEGNETLRRWALAFTRRVHAPAYADFEVLLHPGNTNAWSKVVGLLVEPGDYILCESFTYPSSQALWIPQGNLAAPVALDGQGIRDDALDEMLSTWDATHPGARKPHVLYLVGVGSNPTGTTMGRERRRRVYDVCVKHDVIIVEDDPYYFIQYPEYRIGGGGSTEHGLLPNQQFLGSLAPSFLQFDYQGRVIRLESFSKTLAPGLRLGYFVANPLFCERFLRATEVETQDPSGLSQALVLALLRSWTDDDAYLTWLQRLRVEYQIRRDWLIDAFAQHFRLSPAASSSKGGAEGIVASLPRPDGSLCGPIFSFVPPTGGMFMWTKFHLGQNPRFREMQADETVEDAEQTFADELWAKLVDALGGDVNPAKVRIVDPETTYFRFSFAMVTKEQMEKGIERFAAVIRKSWQA